MRSKIKLSIIILGIGLLSIFAYHVVKKSMHKEETIKGLQSIPDFTLKSIDNMVYTNKDIEFGKATVFIYFNTDCDFCYHEIMSIKDLKEEIKDISLVYVSNEPQEIISTFADDAEIRSMNNIIFLQDSTLSFASKFDVNIIPYTLIYDKNRKLIKRIKGQIKAETILKLLRNEE